MKTIRLRFTGTACTACCAKIEDEIRKLNGVGDVSISVMTGLVKIKLDSEKKESILKESKAIFDRIEPSAQFQI
jgi:copper chaperone CopZ